MGGSKSKGKAKTSKPKAKPKENSKAKPLAKAKPDKKTGSPKQPTAATKPVPTTQRAPLPARKVPIPAKKPAASSKNAAAKNPKSAAAPNKAAAKPVIATKAKIPAQPASKKPEVKSIGKLGAPAKPEASKPVKPAPAKTAAKPAAKAVAKTSPKGKAEAATPAAPTVKRPAKLFFFEVKPGAERVIKRGDKSLATPAPLDIQSRRKGPATEETPEELVERIERELEHQFFVKRNAMRPQMCTKCGINAVTPRFTIDRELGYCASCAEILRLGETKEARRMEFNPAVAKPEGDAKAEGADAEDEEGGPAIVPDID